MNFDQLVELCRETHAEVQRRAARNVDAWHVLRNWLFGWYILEYEQRGADRAEYGAALIRRLSASLTQRLGKGFSARTLEQCRNFYRVFRTIPQTASAK